MNKTELIAAVAEKAELSKKDAEAAITAMVDAITGALSQEEKVQLVGFGSFEVKVRAERLGRNPKTKEEIHIPASKTLAMTRGEGLSLRGAQRRGNPYPKPSPFQGADSPCQGEMSRRDKRDREGAPAGGG